MRILVLGADGMLGSALMRQLKKNSFVTVFGTSLSGPADIAAVDITSAGGLERAFAVARPAVAINCAGIVKSEAADRMWTTNADAPHLMARVAGNWACRLIHISTDCVFDGRCGNYSENDPTNAQDLYGRSKAAGESATLVAPLHCTVIRTSFIGRDPRRGRGLLEWLLQSDQEVAGFANARWSGLSAPELARVIERVAFTPTLAGLYHVVGPVITKLELLRLLVQSFKLTRRILEMETPVIDRTLDGSTFRAVTGYEAPDWATMAEELAAQ